jgi:hypothetical protein
MVQFEFRGKGKVPGGRTQRVSENYSKWREKKVWRYLTHVEDEKDTSKKQNK